MFIDHLNSAIIAGLKREGALVFQHLHNEKCEKQEEKLQFLELFFATVMRLPEDMMGLPLPDFERL